MFILKMNAIVCLGPDNSIGKGNKLVYRIPDDLKRFKQLTLNKTVIMGKKTFDTLPGPLPHRENIIMSRNQNNKEQILKSIKNKGDVFIIGGSEIYKLFEDQIEFFYITRVIGKPKDADVFYIPPLDLFDLVSKSEMQKYTDIEYFYEIYRLKKYPELKYKMETVQTKSKLWADICDEEEMLEKEQQVEQEKIDKDKENWKTVGKKKKKKNNNNH